MIQITIIIMAYNLSMGRYCGKNIIVMEKKAITPVKIFETIISTIVILSK
jgi:hypothetical protein